MWYKRYPIFRVFLAFVLGILWANFFDVPFVFSVSFLLLTLALILALQWPVRLFKPHKSTVFGFVSFTVFMALGLVLSHFQSEQHLARHYRYQDTPDFYHFRLKDQPVAKENSWKVEAEVVALGWIDSIVPCAGRVLLYLKKDSAAASVGYGDEIVYRGNLNELKGPQNPYEFDYRNYLNLKAIYAQAYLPSERWQILKEAEGFSLVGWSADVRNELLAIIRDWPLGEDERDITKALLLGYRYDIKDNLLGAYSAAGATHVLAVSGLHVGIVYMLTFYLLFFMKHWRYGRVLRTLLLLGLLWAYALITGLSPSVVRAATMFSFVAVGTAFKRPTSIYNTLLASAMLLLVIKPTYLFEVGFQLSYLAVLGIVWLQPKFESLLRPRGWVLKQVWTITTVSLAAQLATFPLGLYYFHQFPSLFLISNLLVIPLVTILMYLGLIALIFSVAGWVILPLINLYDWILGVMNSSVQYVESFPAFLIDQVHIARWELVVIYGILGLGFAWLFSGKLWRLRLALSFGLLLVAFQLWENYQVHQRSELTVYAIKGHQALSFLNGGEGVVVADSAFLQDEDAMTFHMRHHLWANNATNVTYVGWHDNIRKRHFGKYRQLMYCGGLKIQSYRPGAKSAPPADIWLVDKFSGLPPVDYKQPATVVFHSQLKSATLQQWQDWAFALQVETVHLSEGYFQLKL